MVKRGGGRGGEELRLCRKNSVWGVCEREREREGGGGGIKPPQC